MLAARPALLYTRNLRGDRKKRITTTSRAIGVRIQEWGADVALRASEEAERRGVPAA
jgi:hypothetical protein